MIYPLYPMIYPYDDQWWSAFTYVYSLENAKIWWQLKQKLYGKYF